MTPELDLHNRRVPRVSHPAGYKMQIFGALLVIIGIPILCILGNQAGLLRIVFPALSVTVGGFLFWRSKPLYVGLVFWLWFLTPFLGRMANFQAGWTSLSSVELAPYITAGIAGIPLLANLRCLANRRTLPYACALVAILYGSILGLTYLPLFNVLRALLNWLVPVIFGLFIYENWQLYPEFRRVIEKTFLYGVLVTGAYGIYQFFVLPDWDRLWMLNVQLNSFGDIDQMKTRAFSTMNAPAIFAAVMACGLLMLLNLKGKLRLLSAACGFCGLVLTLSRASWLSLAAGCFYLILRLDMRARFRLGLAVVACMAVLIGIAQLPDVNQIVRDRLATFTQPGQDVSFDARIEGHEQAMRVLAQEPWGEGIGSTDTLHGTEGDDAFIGPHDSTLLEFLYSLGWVGTLIYLVGLGKLGMQLFRARRSDPFIVSSNAILIGLLAQCLLNSVMLGVLGFMVWTFASMSLAAQHCPEPVEEAVRGGARQEAGYAAA
jgi:O-antigen ligase/polysaccharide polymerase Wzy-like membrane protein